MKYVAIYILVVTAVYAVAFYFITKDGKKYEEDEAE